MRLMISHGLAPPQVVDASRVIVLDEKGNPIALTMVYGRTPDGREMILTAHVGEPGGPETFNQLLHAQGIRLPVAVVDVPAGTPLDLVRFEAG